MIDENGDESSSIHGFLQSKEHICEYQEHNIIAMNVHVETDRVKTLLNWIKFDGSLLLVDVFSE